MDPFSLIGWILSNQGPIFYLMEHFSMIAWLIISCQFGMVIMFFAAVKLQIVTVGTWHLEGRRLTGRPLGPIEWREPPDMAGKPPRRPTPEEMQPPDHLAPIRDPPGYRMTPKGKPLEPPASIPEATPAEGPAEHRQQTDVFWIAPKCGNKIHFDSHCKGLNNATLKEAVGPDDDRLKNLSLCQICAIGSSKPGLKKAV